MDTLRLLTVLLTVVGSQGIYIELKHAQRACYLIEVPKKVTPVQGTWDVKTPQGDAVVVLEAMNTRRDMVFTTTVGPEGNTFYFATKGDEGQYTLCWKVENRNRMSATKIKFDYHLGHGTKKQKATPKYKAEVKDEDPTADELEDVQFEMEQTQDLLDDILSAVTDFREGQEMFKEGARQIESNVWWFGVVQVVIMVGLAAHQVYSLKSFLLQKKLV
eukprot:TRINITY_DN15851_c0_g1_i2.p2 TRINITY_DN15851_c0_g1~~TRINITY_DN15851_c0_g1_i2.p2  ORF type:complete len:231 (+),score=84.97 TRINITY_DN15851_c0_g1_i2:43-693(+)